MVYRKKKKTQENAKEKQNLNIYYKNVQKKSV